MSLKITIEVDGQTEQQLAPIVGQLATRYPDLLATENAQVPAATNPTKQSFYHENAALLQQQIQQLVAQNQLLKAQSTPPQPRLAAAASTSNSAIPIPLDVQPPALPVQYQATPRDRTRYQLQRAAQRLGQCLGQCLSQRMGQRLWQAVVWLSFGKTWLAVLLLFGGGLYGTLKLAPKLADRLASPPEFVDTTTESGPGDVVTPEPADPPAAPSPEAPASAPASSSLTDRSPADRSSTPPPTPASKAGSHPPPPPAFQ